MSAWEGLNPPYSTIVADPPWQYEKVGDDGITRMLYGGGVGGTTPPNPATNYRGKVLPYSSLTLDEIRALPVADVAAKDARLFLWTTNRYLRHSWSVIEAWGFEPLDRVLVWCKTPRGTMNITTEFLLMGRRGRPPRLPWHGTTWFQWPRKAHSTKPAAALDLIESWCPGPYVELFARAPRLGWDSWGKGYENVVP